MVDSISGSGGIVDAQGNLSQDLVQGDFSKALGTDSSLGPDSLALLQAQQKMSLDMQKFELCSQVIKDKDEAAKQAIRNA